MTALLHYLGRTVVDKSCMSIYADKVPNHQKKTSVILMDLDGLKTIGIIEENKEKSCLK
jgi:hypothetical protein